MKLTIIGAALALAIPATAYAASDCCKAMTKHGNHAGHAMPPAPAQ